MHLRKITLENFRLFERIQLETGPRLTLLIGPNGAGKTALLDAVSIGLGAVLTHLPGVEGRSFRKTGDIRQQENTLAPYARVSLESTENIGWDRIRKRDKSRATHILIPDAKGLKQLESFLDNTIIDPMNNNTEYTLPVFAFYGVHRALLELPQRRRGFPVGHDRMEAFVGALNATSQFKTAFIWFYNKENEENRLKIKQRDFDASLSDLNAVRRAISLMFPDLAEPHIQASPLRFLVRRDNQWFGLEQLSDGYKTLLGLVVDLSTRMATANPHLENPLQTPAVVLIDEVDLHLHPAWQRRVVADLLQTFPNTQFIITTHSPFIIESINNSLKRSKIAHLPTSDPEIERIRPLSPDDMRAYVLTDSGAESMLDVELGLLDDQLLHYLNDINAIYDKMRDLEWHSYANQPW